MKMTCEIAMACILLGASIAAPAWAGQYVFADVATPGCCTSVLSAINSHGTVLGTNDNLEGSEPTFKAFGSTEKVLGASIGFDSISNLTNDGLAVGNSETNGGGYIVDVKTGEFSLLPNVSPYSTAPAQINQSGVVVGVALNSSGSVSHRYLYSRGTASLFDPPDSTFTIASVINVHGVVGGSYQATKRTQKAFTYGGGEFTIYAVPGAVTLVVNAIDSSGNLAGQYTDSSSKRHGFVIMSGTVATIDDPNAKETNLNDFGPGGELVGYSVDDNSDSTSHGLIYANGAFTRIDDPKQSMFGSELTAVNASGELAGAYFDGNDFGHPFTAVCPAGQSPCTK